MVEKADDKVIHNPIRWAIAKREALYFMKNKLVLFNPNTYFVNDQFLDDLLYNGLNFKLAM